MTRVSRPSRFASSVQQGLRVAAEEARRLARSHGMLVYSSRNGRVIGRSPWKGLDDPDPFPKFFDSVSRRRGGLLCFKGTRVPVHELFDVLAEGKIPLPDWQRAHPAITPAQVHAVLRLVAANFRRKRNPGGAAEWACRPSV